MWALLAEGAMLLGTATQGSRRWASTERSWHRSVSPAGAMPLHIRCVILGEREKQPTAHPQSPALIQRTQRRCNMRLHHQLGKA